MHELHKQHPKRIVQSIPLPLWAITTITIITNPLDENVALLTPSMIQESGKGIFSKQSHKLTLQNPWAKVALKVFASLEMAQGGPKAKVGAYENVLHNLLFLWATESFA